MKPGRKKGDGKGVHLALTQEQYETMWSLYEKGTYTYTEIAEKMGITKVTVCKYINKGNLHFPALQKRLEEQNTRKRAALGRENVNRAVAFFDTACKAYEEAINYAAGHVTALKDVKSEDRKEILLAVRIANEAHDLSEKWRGTMRALAAGESNEDTMKDLDEYAQTGAVSEALKERMRKVLGENGKKGEQT